MQPHLCVKTCKMYYVLSAEFVHFFVGLQKIILSTVYRANGNVSVMSVGCLMKFNLVIIELFVF